MNSLSRALKYLQVKKVKSLTLIVLFTILLSSILSIFIINDTIKGYYKQIDNTNGIAVNVIATKNPYNQSGEYVGYKESDFSNVLNKEYVTNYRIDYVAQPASQSISVIEMNSKVYGGSAMVMVGGVDNLLINGSTDLSLYPPIKNGEIILTNNNTNLALNDVIISTQLAAQNNLVIGSTFQMTASNGQVFEMRVADTYTVSEKNSYLLNNTIYTNAETAKEFNSFQPNDALGYLTIYINDIENYEQLKRDVNQEVNKGGEQFVLNLDDDVYQQVIKPLEIAKGVVVSMSLLVIFVTLLILIIVMNMLLKDRFYEAKILNTMGISKRSVICQFILESLILATIAFVITAFFFQFFGTYSVEIVDFSSQLQSINNKAFLMSNGAVTGSSQLVVGTSMSYLSLVYTYIVSIIIIVIINLFILRNLIKKKTWELMIEE